MLHGKIVIVDSSVLINFLLLEHLDWLEQLPGHEFHVSEHVIAEVTQPPQAALLKRSIDAGRIRVATITETAEMTLYVELRARLGDGESASLAIAASRGWKIASDERGRFRREADARLGPDRVIGTMELFVAAIRAELMTVDEADIAKNRLGQNRFHMSVETFRKLV